jgi:glycosyltransferase involved in cell wall biosynthesis
MILAAQGPGSDGAATVKLLSVVVPVYFEQEVLAESYRRLKAVLVSLGPELDHEIVLVDDGSRDASVSIIRELAAADPRVRAVLLARNFGHQIAITAGIEAAVGDAVVVIDADLQDPPEVITDMVAKWREGYQVVYGRRNRRPGESVFKLATAKAFYRVMHWLSDVDLPVDTGDFRLMDRAVVDVLNSMHERARYVRGMVTWIGFEQTELRYDRGPRLAGETKYTLRKMVRFAIDGVTSFSSRPLTLAAKGGLVVTFLAFALGVFLVVERFLRPETVVSGWTSMLVVVLFLGGVQLVSVGLLGAYTARVFEEVKGRPLYVVAERIGDAPGATPIGCVQDGPDGESR